MANVSSSNGLEKRPKLRFPGFDEPWRAAQLGDLLIELSDYATRESGFPLLTSSRQGLFVQEDYFIDKQANAETTVFSVLPYGCITYRHMSDDNIFHFNINRLVANGLVSKEYPVFTVRKEVLDTDFLVDTLNSSPLFSVFCIQQKKGGTRTRLYFKTLCSYQMFLPVLHEQQVIASFIRLLGKRIERQMELVETLKKYKRGLLRDVFSRLSASCDMRSLKDVSILFADGDWIESKDQASEGIRLVQTGNVGFGVYLDKPQNAKYISEATFRHLNCLEVCGGDILISRLPEPAGRACLLPETAERRITAVDCTVIRMDASVMDKNYLLQFLCSEQYLITVNSFLAGGTRQRISRKNLEGIKVPYPSINKQRHYGDFLSKVDARILNAEHQLNCLNRLRCFMLQQLFI